MDWAVYAWVKRGSRRRDLLKLLLHSKHPLAANEIKNELKISLSQVSLLLKELSKKDLISCLNPKDNIGKIYKITQNGEEIFRKI